MQLSNSTAFIPDNRGKILPFGWELVKSLYHFSTSTIVDLTRSVLGKPPLVLKSEMAWHQNLSLMQSAQELTTNRELNDRIRFLAVNYLNKVAPLMPLASRFMGWNLFESSFQVSPYSPYQYHRAFCRYRPEFSSKVNQRFALGDKSPLVLTDTIQFDQFFPLKFVVLNRQNANNWSALVKEAMRLNKELLIDLTDDLGAFLLTEQNQANEAAFSGRFGELKEEISKLAEGDGEMQAFLKQKCVAVARTTIDCNGTTIGGMKILPLFNELNPKNICKLHSTLMRGFIEETGIALGAIQLRRLLPEVFPLPEIIQDLQDPYDSIDFKSALNEISQMKFEVQTNKPHIDVLGNSFLTMLKGLLDNSQWQQLRQDDATNIIIQTVLTRIVNHLRDAEESVNEDNRFMQAIELAHAELATLLELTAPYDSADFATTYLNKLNIIPDSLKSFLKGGLGKTAETVFAGVNLAVLKQNPNARSAFSNWFYFEHANFLPGNQRIDALLRDGDLANLDLYGCAFNPSLESDINNTDYAKNDLIADVEKILDGKSNSQHLTVAIDFTNDYINSTNAKGLLARFEQEILDGKLNVVFFGSGQKFDMLGMDHFYGSPFYMVNNGAEHWKGFDELLTAEVNQTDRLSTQWFCLLYDFAFPAIDQFRQLFFQNVRDVLNHVPATLAPGQGKNISISRVDENADPTFIDIKIQGLFHKIKASILIGYFQGHAVLEKVKASIRGSFGFLHPNATLIFAPDSTTLRLHPGINIRDNRALHNFIHSL